MNQNKFYEELRKLNLNITKNQENQLEEYYKILIEWNKFMNLTGITKKEEVYLKHFYDSISLVKIIDLNSIETVCDIGTGAGFPGIVLKIMFPHLKITLLDSLNKRINFLKEVIEKLNLKDIETIHCRVEDYGKNNREKYDLVVARAVAPLYTLIEYSIPLVKVNKNFIAMKSDVEQEINDSTNALKLLDSKIVKKIKFNLPIENSLRNLVMIEKLSKTKSKYPRKYKEIKTKRL